MKKSQTPLSERVHAKRQTQEQKDERDEALARALADYQNLVNRVEREKLEIISRAGKNIIEELLPVLDNLERTEKYLKDPGLQLAMAQLKQILEKNGVQEIKAGQNEQFDHDKHEAIDSIEGGEHGKIATVHETGYMWKDGRIIRPAKVIVWKGETNNG